MDMDEHGWTWTKIDEHGLTWMVMGRTWMDMDEHE